MTGDKNQSRIDSLTPLHLADGKGHFQVCTFRMENLENKNPIYQKNSRVQEKHGRIQKHIG